jgi:hypothetical protein
MHHPVVGNIEFTCEALTVTADDGLTIITYTVEPASKSSEALKLLGSWGAQETGSKAQPGLSPDRMPR